MMKWLEKQWMRINPIGLYGLLWFVLTYAILAFYSYQMEILYYGVVKSVIALALMVIPLLVIGRFLVLNIAFNTFLGSLMLANVIYFRYFNDMFSLGSVANAIYLDDVLSSVLALIRGSDALYVGWIVLSILLVKKFQAQVRHPSKALFVGLTLALLCLMLMGTLSENYKKSIQKETLLLSLFGEEEVPLTDQTDQVYEVVEAAPPLPSGETYLKGLGLGRNLIVIQVESLQDMVLEKKYENQAITPHLNALLEEDTLYFTNIYQQLGKSNTADAEWVVHNSLYAPISGKAYEDYLDKDYMGLPWLMKEEGYRTLAFHGNQGNFWNREAAYPGQGFDEFISLEDLTLDEGLGLGLSDGSFFKQSASMLEEIQQPFYAFLVTLTSHHPFDLPLEDQDFQISEADQDTIFGQYLESIHYTDQAIGDFIQDLKDRKLYDNSVIVIYGDHFGLNPNDGQIKEQVSTFMGYSYEFDLAMNIPLLVHIPGYGGREDYDIVGGQVDVLPTLENLFAIDDYSPYQMGQDLLNPIRQGISASQTYMLKGSFIDKDKVFEMSRDGIFAHSRAWQIQEGTELDVELCRAQYQSVIEMIDRSNGILMQNLMAVKGQSDSGLDLVVSKQVPDLPKYVIRLDGRQEVASYGEADHGLDFMEDQDMPLVELTFIDHNDQIYARLMDGQVVGLDLLCQWLGLHDGTRIIIDTEGDVLDLLANINAKHPDLRHRFIPQIYAFDAYVKVAYMGYQDIVLNLKKSTYQAEELLDFINLHEVYAITMPEAMAKIKLREDLNQAGIFVYIDSDEASLREAAISDGRVNGGYQLFDQ